MSIAKNDIRLLNNTEQAFTLTNEVFPLVVVNVLHLQNGPSPGHLEVALRELQNRHELLRAAIHMDKRGMQFESLDPVSPIPLQIMERKDKDSFRPIAEEVLNTKITASGPLMRTFLLYQEGGKGSELIIAFHHALIDAASARLLLHELLCLLGEVPLPSAATLAKNATLAKSRYPDAYRGFRLLRKLLPMMGRQMKEMRHYKKHGLSAPIPSSPVTAMLSFQFSKETSQQLIRKIARLNLSLNSLILAAIAMTTCKRLYQVTEEKRIRLITFAALRSKLLPPLENEELGCYTSMLRLNVAHHPEQSLPELAKEIQKATVQASKRGELFLMAFLSKYLVKLTMKARNERLGLAALSFIGKLDLAPAYGSIQLKQLETYISNNPLGPQFSAFGKVLFGQLGLDFIYLAEEIKKEEAKTIVNEIKQLIESLLENS